MTYRMSIGKGFYKCSLSRSIMDSEIDKNRIYQGFHNDDKNYILLKPNFNLVFPNN